MAIELVRGSTRLRVLTTIGLIAAGVLLVRLPFSYGPYRVYQFTLVIIWAIAVMGLNLLVGYNGQISIGQGAFFGVGAYTAAVLMHRYDTPFVVCVIAAAAVTFALGVVIGIPASRLRGLHLAIVTLAVAIGATALLQRFESVTGGAGGMTVRKLRAPAWTGLADDQYLYFVALIIGVVMFLLAHFLVRSPFGRAMVAIKDNPLAADAMGIDQRVVKVLTFAVCSAFAGVGGVLYAVALAYVSPEAFPLLLSVTFLAAVAVGGFASIWGSLLGAVFVQYVPQYASEINDSLATLIYGLILIVVTVAMPDGLAGRIGWIARRVVRVVDPIERRSVSVPVVRAVAPSAPHGTDVVAATTTGPESAT